ncbi:hypothetical protein L873DRAFT_1786885 [Choiromyces venosus 120613-1]|uniref:Uncharacterized protein n=1 Tax=Choiromyces venosus 120613-1 TaxID=1336337 RepID=A0A3N4K2L4_9PEZI|nr:hypothetical protein L873DRAFT_1786885 [Choiromyces venosus 120613-1]
MYMRRSKVYTILIYLLGLMKSAHKTEQVHQLLHSYEIIPSLILPECTSLVQLLEVSINKPLKERIRELTDKVILNKFGLSLPADGSKDHEIDIKEFEEIEIGYWKIDGKEVEAIPYNDILIVDDSSNDAIEFIAIEFIANGE